MVNGWGLMMVKLNDGWIVVNDGLMVVKYRGFEVYYPGREYPG